jgi:hypothetical protein
VIVAPPSSSSISTTRSKEQALQIGLDQLLVDMKEVVKEKTKFKEELDNADSSFTSISLPSKKKQTDYIKI